MKGLYWSQCSWQRSAANIRAASSSSAGSRLTRGIKRRAEHEGRDGKSGGRGEGSVSVSPSPLGEAPGFTVAPRGAGGDALPAPTAPSPRDGDGEGNGDRAPRLQCPAPRHGAIPADVCPKPDPRWRLSGGLCPVPRATKEGESESRSAWLSLAGKMRLKAEQN